jgi:hypothetical protein
MTDMIIVDIVGAKAVLATTTPQAMIAAPSWL